MIARRPLAHWVPVLIGLAVIVRVVLGLPRGEDGLLRDGYEFYATIARTFLDGHGLCYSIDGGCAARMPIYPLWLAGFIASGTFYPGVILGQAIIGATLTWIAWELGRRLFDDRAGLLAASAAAFSPYAVVHDTALQDTVFINVLMPLALLWLVCARRTGKPGYWIGGGLALAMAVLTSARISLFVPFALAWAMYAAGGPWRSRVRAAALVAVPLMILVGGWMQRNWMVVGQPVLTTEGGEELWFANSPRTFAKFPERSIDLTVDELLENMPADTREMLEHFPGSEVERDALVGGWAIDYMIEDPLRTAWSASRKIWVAASAQLSPSRGWVTQAGYRIVFLPIHLLAVWTLWRHRRSADHQLTWLLLAAFAITTGAFWAHTSHKSYLDAVLFVYAAAALCSPAPARVTAGAPA